MLKMDVKKTFWIIPIIPQIFFIISVLKNKIKGNLSVSFNNKSFNSDTISFII